MAAVCLFHSLGMVSYERCNEIDALLIKIDDIAKRKGFILATAKQIDGVAILQ